MRNGRPTHKQKIAVRSIFARYEADPVAMEEFCFAANADFDFERMLFGPEAEAEAKKDVRRITCVMNCTEGNMTPAGKGAA